MEGKTDVLAFPSRIVCAHSRQLQRTLEQIYSGLPKGKKGDGKLKGLEKNTRIDPENDDWTYSAYASAQDLLHFALKASKIAKQKGKHLAGVVACISASKLF